MKAPFLSDAEMKNKKPSKFRMLPTSDHPEDNPPSKNNLILRRTFTHDKSQFYIQGAPVSKQTYLQTCASINVQGLNIMILDSEPDFENFS